MAKNGNLLTSSAADACRRNCADWSSPSSESANASPAASASARDCWFSANAPLCTIARSNRPREPRRHEVLEHVQAAGGLPGDGDPVRVAAELPDVVAHPAQRGLLVHQSVVAGRATGPGGQGGVGQEAEHSEPVVDGDDDERRRPPAWSGRSSGRRRASSRRRGTTRAPALPGDGPAGASTRSGRGSPRIEHPAGVNGVGPGWRALGANWVASRTPFHSAGGCGGFHRRSPVGGAAYGSPRKAYPPSAATPRTCRRRW